MVLGPQTIGLAMMIIFLFAGLSGCGRTDESDAATPAADQFVSQLDSGLERFRARR
jgi:hypothetical protein